MSRIMRRTKNGRQPPLSTPKVANPTELINDTYQDTNNKKRKPDSRYVSTVQQAKKRRRAPSTPTESSALSSDAEDEASEDDSESDEDEPLENAPSLSSLAEQAGRPFQNEFDDNVSDAGSVGSTYDPNFQFAPGDIDLFPMTDINDKVFPESDEDNDEEAYKAVDDISDSEDGDIEAYEEQQLLAMLSENEVGEGEFLNQIDGLSDYGFGDESDATAHFPPSSYESETEPAQRRHVHFDIDSADALQAVYSSSPTISRALLPSAMPEHGNVFGGPASASAQAPQDSPVEDAYDSDATDEDLPAEAVQQAAAEMAEPAEVKAEEGKPPFPAQAGFKKPQRRGPPRGIFIDEGTKASGILDPTGKIMLITHPHLLGEAFARRYGNSAPASPSAGFQELIDTSDAGDSQATGEVAAATDPVPEVDTPVAPIAISVNLGRPAGPEEAFYPVPGFETGDYMLDLEDFADGDSGEEVIDINDVIKFDDSEDSDEPTSAIYMPPKTDLSLPSAIKPPSFANTNITAFRNNADPNFSPFSPLSASNFSQLAELSTPACHTPSSHKRKRTLDSPYKSSHYAGVQPIQRMRDPNPPSAPPTPDPALRRKRRRLTMTL